MFLKTTVDGPSEEPDERQRLGIQLATGMPSAQDSPGRLSIDETQGAKYTLELTKAFRIFYNERSATQVMNPSSCRFDATEKEVDVHSGSMP